MEIAATVVKELRERTGAGMMDCKSALLEAGGDLERAGEVLRKRGISRAQHRSGREAHQGLVEAYIHPGGKIGVLVEVNCETDFVARTEEFRTLVRDLAMQVAATNPLAVSREGLDPAVIAKEREIYLAQARQLGKPEKVLEKIVDGKMDKFYQEVCLVDQAFVKDPDRAVLAIISGVAAKVGENIMVRRFTRYQLGG